MTTEANGGKNGARIRRTDGGNIPTFMSTQFFLSEEVVLSETDRVDCVRLVSQASETICHPSQSQFHVKAAGLTESGKVIRGGNDENSFCDAYTHGETSVMSQARTQGEKVRIIGFYNPSEREGDLNICPCGACRDVLIQHTSPDLLLVSGNEKKIVVRKLAEYLRDDFSEVPVQRVNPHGIEQGIVALKSASSGYASKETLDRAYGVSLISKNGLSRARGSFDTNAGYDAISAGLAAVKTFKNTVDPTTPEDLEEIVVVGIGKIPHLLSRDKAELLELDEILRRGGRTSPLPIYLVALNPETLLPINAQVTDTQECFPNPFSAGSFGMTEALDQGYRTLFHAAS